MGIISGQRSKEEELRGGTWKKIAVTECRGKLKNEGRGTSMGADSSEFGQKGWNFM